MREQVFSANKGNPFRQKLDNSRLKGNGFIGFRNLQQLVKVWRLFLLMHVVQAKMSLQWMLSEKKSKPVLSRRAWSFLMAMTFLV